MRNGTRKRKDFVYYCWRNDKFQIIDVKYDCHQESNVITHRCSYMRDGGRCFTCCSESISIVVDSSIPPLQTRIVPSALQPPQGSTSWWYQGWAILLLFG